MSEALNRVLSDTRRDWGSDEVRRVDWDGIDKRLFARIKAEQRAERTSLAAPRSRPWWAIGLGLAATAAAAFAMKTREPRSLDPAERASVVDDAGNILDIAGEGDVLVNGRPAKVGATLQLDDVIDTRGAEATLGRAGKVTFVVERASRATVTHVQGALVLALAQGAVEAQVVPVASGEALAVDIGPSRVAVHGTHLRVARTGDHVVVDLNEGVVAVGEAPRVGSTLGELVTAPAHAEFTATDAHGTLRVTHDLSAVRAPASLGPTAQLKTNPPLSPAPTPASRGEANEASPSATAVGSPHAEPRGAATAAGGATPVPSADPNAQFAVAAGVRACMSERLHVDDVTVVVSTTLYLQLQDDGAVRSARFDPPVAPDVNACAAQTIYRARFTHAGAVTIPISVKN